MLTKRFLTWMSIKNIVSIRKSFLMNATGNYRTSATLNADIKTAGMTNSEVFPNYNTQQKEQILNVINSASLEQLLSYEISKARAIKLQSWIKKNGPIKSAENLLEIDGLSVKILQKLCNSILSGNLSQKGLRPRSAAFVIPSVEETQRLQIRSCTAVRIGVASVSWARLELSADDKIGPCVLTDWQHYEVNEKKMHLKDLVYRCRYIDHLLPAADCYLFENPQMAQINANPGNADQQNVSIQKAQITSILGFALSMRRRIFDELDGKEIEALPNVFYLRRFLAARLFNHLVGMERVSSEQVIINLMRTYYNVEDMEDIHTEIGEESTNENDKERFSFLGNVQFSQNSRIMFSQAERHQREFLGQALLLNLAFVRLVLLQDAYSIALVTRNKRAELTK